MNVHVTSIPLQAERSLESGTERARRHPNAGPDNVVAGVALTALLHAVLLVGATSLHAAGVPNPQPDVPRKTRSAPLVVELRTVDRSTLGRPERGGRAGSDNLRPNTPAGAPPRRSVARSRSSVSRPAAEAPAPPAVEESAAPVEAATDEAVTAPQGAGDGANGATSVDGKGSVGSASSRRCCGAGHEGSGPPASTMARTPARLLFSPRPSYPRQARLMGWEGSVVVRVLVDAQGNAAQVTVVSSSGQSVLDQSAVEAVRGWRFSPAVEAGKAVTMLHDVRIRFRLDDYPA